MENVQSETYSSLIDTYIKDSDEKCRLLNATQYFPCIRRKANWARKCISDDSGSFATRPISFAIVEDLFFTTRLASTF